ncbi:serine hydrolase [uncultured Winogradskyella sp.]|uniref:serine hydrolase n=1 Tax=uncultured Winogradskyella sp. TaxID=395353 RepID=UPI0030ED91DF|tara:strand:+ start:1107 stop:2693 length:1587 start_codon:yes stop_codon:yes gene_type:complete
MKIFKNQIVFSLLFLVFTLTTLHAQMTSQQIDSLVLRAIEKIDYTVGFSIGVVKDGKILHAKGYGLTEVNSNTNVTEHTPFGIASNSKAFTSAALAILVDQDKITWTDKVIDHIPEFKMYNDYVTNNFTIQDLLTHRSGLALGVGDLMLFPNDSDFTIDDVLNSFQYFKPISEFRTKFDYDNLLYLVAGELTARVTSQTWETFVETNILKPLGMTNSSGSLFTALNYETLAAPHGFINDTIVALNNKTSNNKMNGAAGGIWSSATDMSQWILTQLNEGKYGTDLKNTLFSLEQQQEMWRIHTVIPRQTDPNSPFKSHFYGYGLGWMVSDFNGFLHIEHSGLIEGMTSDVVIIPELEFGFVLLNNSEKSVILNGLIMYALLDEFLDLNTGINWVEMGDQRQKRQNNNIDTITEAVWQQVETHKNTTYNKDHYIGIYEDNWFGKVEIFNNHGDLWFKSFKSPRLNGKLQFYKDQTFAIKWEYQDMNADALATFTLDKKGKAQSITMKGISEFIDFSFDFQDLDLRRIGVN